MAQKKSTWIDIAKYISTFSIAIVGVVVGVVTNKISEGENYKNAKLIFLVILLLFLLVGVQVLFEALKEEDSNSKRRQLLLSVASILIGGGGVSLFFLPELMENSTLSESKVVSPTPLRSTPTQKPTEVTPNPKVTPNPEPTPSMKTSIPKLVRDSFSSETVRVDERGEIVKRDSKTISMWIEDLGEGIKLEMVYIPGGTFNMGSRGGEKGREGDESLQRDVTIQPFLMGRYAVTQAQWKRVSTLARIQIDFGLGSDPSYFKDALRPVEQVSWHEAREFCARLSKATNREYRLPSESEWEYACRAGTLTPFYFGETITTELANYDGNHIYGQESKGIYREQTTKVGTFLPNTYGLFDMHGNTWEWCADQYNENTWFSSNKDSMRVIRGGSWFNSPERCRSANRTPLDPNNRGVSAKRSSSNVGFRIVCVPKEIESIFQ